MKQSLKNYLNQTREILATPALQNNHARLLMLLQRHRDAVSAFQHERLVHLIVTLFFAFLLVASLVGTLWQPTIAFMALDALIAATLIGYIYHYYFLENYVQKLYPITEIIYQRIGECHEKL